MSRLLRRLFARPVAAPRNVRKVRRISDLRARLLLQSLEDRVTPATFTVTNGNDQDPSTGTIPAGSFRDILNQANANADADIINFAAGVTRVDRTTTQFTISQPVTINGAGVTIDGHGLGRVLNISGTGVLAVTLNGLTVTGGATGSVNGAGIYTANENVTLNNCVITGNATSTGVTNGGGIATGANGLLTLNNSTISGNSTSGAGGGIYFRGFANGRLSITNSTISGNAANTGGSATATNSGGGIFCYYMPTANAVTITNSTISGNSGLNGGGLQFRYFYTNQTIQNCTITNNSATSTSPTAGRSGGGISKITGGGTLNLISSIVSGNSAVAPSSTIPLGASRADISVAGSGRVNATFSAIGADPGPLALRSPSNNNLGFGAALNLQPLSNGTHALGAGSLAIDHGSNPAGLTTDQRGGANNRIAGNAADIGAFESTFTSPVSLGQNLADVTAGGATTYTFQVQYLDSTGIQVSTLNTNDIRVTGPGSFNVVATFVSVDNGTNGSPRTATYSFTPPGGSWDAADNGTYTASLQANEVSSVGGVAVPASPVGSFHTLISLATVVTNANDTGAGSLRQAILDTNAAPTVDTITFDPTFFATARTINLASQLPISDNVTITGPGAALLTLQPTGAAAAPARIFSIDGTSAAFNGSGRINVTISGMTLTGGHTTGGVANDIVNDGGAIVINNENVTLNNTVITGNTAGTGQGGGIAVGAYGSLTLTNSTVSGNSVSGTGAAAANAKGGGIYFLYSGSLVVRNSTISGNSASGSGGGVFFYGAISGEFTVQNSTISGNTAGGNGGGVYVFTSDNYGSYANISNTADPTVIAIHNSTITGNVANNTTPPATGGGGTGGGGISQRYLFNVNTGVKAVPATMDIVSSIISGNTNSAAPDISNPPDPRAGTPNVNNAVLNLSNSAIGNASGFTVSGTNTGNLAFGAALNLGPLTNNGGPTFTHALLPGSAAIDKGSNPDSLTTDQRGGTNLRLVGPAVDIGAFEVQAAGSPASVQSATVNAGQANTTQRSQVTSITVTFNTVVTFNGPPQTNAFQLTRTGPGTPNGNVTLTVDTSGSTATQTIAKLTFSGALTEGSATNPSLIDGNYTLTVLSSGISVGLTGGNSTTNLFRLFGDIDGNKAVNGIDLAAFRTAFGSNQADPTYQSYLDFDGNGAINGVDLTQFRNRFGVILP